MEEHKMDGEKRLEEKCLERKVVYKGKSYEFFVDRVELPDGTGFAFSGQVSTKIDSAAVNAALTFTATISLNSDMVVTNPTE